MEPTILYEDDDILAVNKPAGLVVHSDGKTKEKNLADWIALKYPQTKDVGEPSRMEQGEIIPRPGIVHRLDRETSGVMLVAKTQKGFEYLKKQFQAHEIEKTYHAFVYGNIATESGVIERPIGRSKKDFRMWSAQRGARGEMREAVTEYKVVSHNSELASRSGQGGYSFVSVSPKTGRTHQIRVHFKAIHHPLVADSLYAPGRENSLGFTRLALHSHTVTFITMDGTKETVTAPYPADFKHALTLLQR